MKQRPSVIFNCLTSDVKSTLGVLSFHRSTLRELSKYCKIYMLNSDASKNVNQIVEDGWDFITGFYDLNGAISLIRSDLSSYIEICAHHFQPPALPLKNIGFVFDLHAFDIPWKYPPKLRELLKKCLAANNAIVTMFPRTYYDIEKIVQFPLTNLFLLESPLLVKPPRWNANGTKKAQPPTFLYPAQFQMHKNHIGLLNGLKSYFDRGGDARLVLTGTDAKGIHSSRALVEESISNLGLAQHVEVAGHVKDDELQALYTSCHGMIVPSLAEGGGYVPLEGVYAGLPVAVNDLPSTRMHLQMFGAVVDYFDSTDRESTADAFEALSKADRVRLGKLNEPARARLDSLSWGAVAANLLEIITWVLNRRDRPIMSIAPGYPTVRLM